MSILIKGIKMPKKSYECPCHNGENCNVTQKVCFEPPKDCPLVEIQTPHGELIDVDTIDFTNNDDTSMAFNIGASWAIMQVARAKTVIESEK